MIYVPLVTIVTKVPWQVKGEWLSAYDGKPYSRPYPIGTGNNKDDQMYLGPISCSI